MKFELKTENESYSKSFSQVFITILSLVFLIIFCNTAIKLAIISRHFQIYHYCSLLSFEKSTSNFKKLSGLSNLKSKQKIWEFCRGFVK